MTYYSEHMTEIDTPYFDETIDYEDAYEHGLQIRMALLFTAVGIVITSLAIFVINMKPAVTISEPVSNTSTAVQDETSSLEISPAANNLPAGLGIAPLFTPEIQYWEEEIVRWSQEHGLDPNAVATIMQIESCGDPSAVSIAGAQGLFQVMPFHFSNGENMQDPDTNARRGLNFLNEQLRFTGGDMGLSFAGYNGGYAASGGSYTNWASETQAYYQWATGIYADAQSGAISSETLDAWLAAGGGAGCQQAATRLGL